MTCARWLTLTAAATRLNLPVEEVQRLVDAKVLYAEWLHRDHWVISEASVVACLPVAGPEDAMSAYLCAEEPEMVPTPTYRGGPRLDPETEEHYAKERES